MDKHKLLQIKTRVDMRSFADDQEIMQYNVKCDVASYLVESGLLDTVLEQQQKVIPESNQLEILSELVVMKKSDYDKLLKFVTVGGYNFCIFENPSIFGGDIEKIYLGDLI